MRDEVKFTPIDLQTWPRGQVFYYFSQMAPTGYSMTVDLDVTQMRISLKKANLKFFPAYLWLVTKTLNMQQEFKIAKKDGQIMLPLSITCHHAATDGYHVSCFLETLQSEMEVFEKYI